MLQKIKQKFNARSVFPATSLQASIFYEYERNKESNITIRVFVWHGKLDIKKLSNLLIRHFSKNQIFNCFFVKDADKIYGVEAKNIKYSIETIDAKSWQIQDIELDIRERAKKCFKISSIPLWRIYIYESTNNEHIIATIFHNIIIDFYSLKKIFNLIPDDYLSNKNKSLYSFTAFEKYAFHEEDTIAELKQDYLNFAESLPNVYKIPFPYDKKLTAQSEIGMAHYFMNECRGVTYKILKSIISSNNFSEKKYFIAKLIYFLSKKLITDSITITVTQSNRKHIFNDVIGPIYNFIPVSISNINTCNFHDVIEKVNYTLKDLDKYTSFPFPPAKINRQILFSYFLGADDGFQIFRIESSINKKHTLKTKKASISVYPMSSTVINFDLHVTITHAHNTFILTVFYQDNLFSVEKIKNLFHDFFEIKD